MANDFMTIREMSNHFSVTLRLLRFYEEKELLFPIREGQRRFFDKKNRARLKLILRGQKYGFTLEEMRRLLNLYDSGEKYQQLVEVHNAGVIRLQDLKQKRTDLDDTITDLEQRLFDCAEQLSNEQHMNKSFA